MVGGADVNPLLSSALTYGGTDAFLDGLERLAADPQSWWHDVLIRNDVFVAVRRNSLNVYHRGASIFRIDDAGAGSISPKTHVKYLVRQQQALAELLPDNTFSLPPGGAAWLHYDGSVTLNDMLRSASDLAGPEKTGLHPLVLGHSRVIDVEVSLERADGELTEPPSSKKPIRDQDRLDVVTLEARGAETFVVFHEAKHFSNPALRAKMGSIPAVIGQISRYRTTLAHHAAQLQLRYVQTCRALCRIEIMRARAKAASGNPALPSGIDSLIAAVAAGQTDINVDSNPRLIVFGFDGDQKKGLLQSYLKNLKLADPSLDIYAVGDPTSATGAFKPPAVSKL
jgi:hypothetical protein